MKDPGPVTLTYRDAVAQIRFRRPAALNRLDRETAEAFGDLCRVIAQNHDIRCITITGEGRAFMAGGDVSEFAADPARAPETVTRIMAPYHEGLRLLRSQNAPVVTAVQGVVAGGGIGLVIGSDFVLAAEDATFVFAFTRIGGSADGSTTFHLPRLLGIRRSMEFALLGEPIEAAGALRSGLVNRVVAGPDLLAECDRLADRLAAGPTQSYGTIRRLFDRSLHSTFEDQLEAERLAFMTIATTEDFREGCRSFLEKRPPAFSGR